MLAERGYRLMVLGSPGKGAAPGESRVAGPLGCLCFLQGEVVAVAGLVGCPHGFPTAARCSHCRRRAVQLAGGAVPPTSRTQSQIPLVSRPVPKPVWFDTMVKEAQREAKR